MQVRLSQETRFPNQVGIWVRQLLGNGINQIPFEVIPTRKVLFEGTEIQLYQGLAITEQEDSKIINIWSLFDELDSNYNPDKQLRLAHSSDPNKTFICRSKEQFFDWINTYTEITQHKPKYLIEVDNVLRPINPTWEESLKTTSDLINKSILKEYEN